MVREPLLEIGDPAGLESAVDVLSADAVRIRPGTWARTVGSRSPPTPIARRARTRVEPTSTGACLKPPAP